MDAETPPLPHQTLRVNVDYAGKQRPFVLFDTPLGRLVFQEVMTGKSYPAVPIAGEIKTIVDVGANVGAATVYFAIKNPQARVFSFEPSPQCYALLTENSNGLDQVKTFNFGLSNKDQATTLFQGRQDSVTNSIHASCFNKSDGVPVQVKAADAVLRELQIESIDILKIDTEGCEVPILNSLRRLLPHVGVIYFEYHHSDDRIQLDRLLEPTHVLFRGKVNSPHRGEFCYVVRNRTPTDAQHEQIGISQPE